MQGESTIDFKSYDCICGHTSFYQSASLTLASEFYFTQCFHCSYPLGQQALLRAAEIPSSELCCPHCKTSFSNISEYQSSFIFVEESVPIHKCSCCSSFVPLLTLSNDSTLFDEDTHCCHLRRRFTIPLDSSLNSFCCWNCERCPHKAVISLKDDRSICSCSSYSHSALSLVESAEFSDIELFLYCNVCKVHLILPKIHPVVHSILTCGTYGKASKSVLVNQVNKLHPGDHIFFRRSAYDHHAIVSLVDYEEGKFSIIHYTADGGLVKASSASASSIFSAVGLSRETPTIVETYDVSLEEHQGILYKVVYFPLDCLPGFVVVQRAQSRLGEAGYCLIRQNCEHFALYCKVGDNSTSNQVNRFYSGLNRSVMSVLTQPEVSGAIVSAPFGRNASRSVALVSSVGNFYAQWRHARGRLRSNEIGVAHYGRQVLRSAVSNSLRASYHFLPSPFGTLSLIGANTVDYFLEEEPDESS